MTARVKAERKRVLYFRDLHEPVREAALREVEALAVLLRGRATLRQINAAAWRVQAATGRLCGSTAWLAKARANYARVKAGKRRVIGLDLGWTKPDMSEWPTKAKKAKGAGEQVTP